MDEFGAHGRPANVRTAQHHAEECEVVALANGGVQAASWHRKVRLEGHSSADSNFSMLERAMPAACIMAHATYKQQW